MLAGSVVTDLKNKDLTAEKLRTFLGGGSGRTLDSVSRALAAYNKKFGGQSDLAGSFLLDKKGSPIGLNIGFDGNKQTSEPRFCYNLAGNLEVRLNSRIHQGVSEDMNISWFNKSLSKEQVAKIESLARAVENDHLYSTLAVPLAYCRYNRLSALRGDTIDFSKSHEYFSSHAMEVTSAYKGGACFTLAELLRDNIRQQTGAEAYVVSRLEDNLVANWPKLDGKGSEINEHVYDLLGPNTHTDVVVPYVKDGEKCYIHIAVGMGSDFSTPGLCHINHWGNDAESLDVGAMYLARDKLIANPERLAAQGIRCKPKIFMKNNETGAIFGLDLLAGHMYFNTRAHDTVGAKFEENESVQKKISYENADNFKNGLLLAVNLFRLDRDFFRDVIFLMDNRQQYLKEVVLPPASNIAHCHGFIQEARSLVKMRGDLISQLSEDLQTPLSDSSKATVLLLRAQTAVLESSAENAASLYTQGLNALRQEIAEYTAMAAALPQRVIDK